MNNTIATAEQEVMKSALLTQHDFDTCDLASLIGLMNERHDQAIAAAVQVEREACKLAAANAVMRVKTSTRSARNMTLAEFRSVCSCAAEDAIKARNTPR